VRKIVQAILSMCQGLSESVQVWCCKHKQKLFSVGVGYSSRVSLSEERLMGRPRLSVASSITLLEHTVATLRTEATVGAHCCNNVYLGRRWKKWVAAWFIIHFPGLSEGNVKFRLGEISGFHDGDVSELFAASIIRAIAGSNLDRVYHGSGFLRWVWW
jgi:hypothetical protein